MIQKQFSKDIANFIAAEGSGFLSRRWQICCQLAMKRKSSGGGERKSSGGKAVKAERTEGALSAPAAQILDWFCVSI